MGNDKVIDIIAKLHAKAVSAHGIGSIEEAKAFATKVNELLLKHKLSMSEIEISRLDETDPMGETIWDGSTDGLKQRSKRVAWMETLASMIARAHFCRIMVQRGSNKIWFIGRKSDREVVEYLYSYLARVIDQAARKGYRVFRRQLKKEGRYLDESHGWKGSFRDGAILEIHKRFVEARQAAQSAAGKKFALIKLADNAVDKYLDQRRGGKASSIGGRSGGNLEGYGAGKDFGRSVGLSRGVRNGNGGTKALN